MTEIRWFNKNRSCIEIRFWKCSIRANAKFNKNRSCIEMELIALAVLEANKV